MSIEQSDVVDFIGVDNNSGELVLTIADQFPWKEKDDDHLVLLQTKINTYLRFIESGELVESYPNAKGRRVLIRVVGKFMLSSQAKHFYDQAIPVVEAAGIKMQFEHMD